MAALHAGHPAPGAPQQDAAAVALVAVRPGLEVPPRPGLGLRLHGQRVAGQGHQGQGAVLMLLSAQAAVTGDSAAAEQFCADWEREVRAAVPPAQLLTFRASDGWAPLCEFLDTAVPDCPYPRLNNAQQFRMGYTRCRLARSPALNRLSLHLQTPRHHLRGWWNSPARSNRRRIVCPRGLSVIAAAGDYIMCAPNIS